MAWRLIDWRASEKRVVTVVINDARWGGSSPLTLDSAPRSASVNSRTRLSTCAFADSSSDVGTSPSDTR
jgi:hypothetical protein